MLRQIVTRFRAYQLGSPGSSFSYFADNHFTLIEARRTDTSARALAHELQICGKSTIEMLHISSWDADHCNPAQLQSILNDLKPGKIEYPGYSPHCDSAQESLHIINRYRESQRARSVVCQAVDPPYITSLEEAGAFGYKHILCHPKMLSATSNNDNSTVKFFRTGSFNVLSLGDLESAQLSSYIRSFKSLQRETDVMILAHHGADNGFTNKKLLQSLNPAVAICTSNFDNQFDHPKQEIRDLLFEHGIKLFTTKTGDVVIKSIGDHSTWFEVINLKADSTEISSTHRLQSKKSAVLSKNEDTIRNIYNRRTYGPKR